MQLLACYHQDGSKRAIWSDQVAPLFRPADIIPERASRVEVIRAGKRRGEFHVDFSLLAEVTQDPSYAVCLVKTYDSYPAAVAAEVDWLRENFILPKESDA